MLLQWEGDHLLLGKQVRLFVQNLSHTRACYLHSEFKHLTGVVSLREVLPKLLSALIAFPCNPIRFSFSCFLHAWAISNSIVKNRITCTSIEKIRQEIVILHVSFTWANSAWDIGNHGLKNQHNFDQVQNVIPKTTSIRWLYQKFEYHYHNMSSKEHV